MRNSNYQNFKILLAVIATFLLFSSRVMAFFRDSFSFGISDNFDRAETQIDISGGTPPARWASGFWLNSLRFKSFESLSKLLASDEDMKPSSLMYTSVFNQNISPELNLVAGFSLGRRNALSDLASSYNTLFSSGFIFLNSKWDNHNDSYWSLGVIFLDQTASVKMVPGFGFNYISPNDLHRWIFTFPAVGYLHQPTDSFYYGVIFQYENDSFNLNPNSSYATNLDYQYIAIERATLGPIARFKVGEDGFWITGKINSTLWGQTVLMKREDPRQKRDRLQSVTGFTVSLALSYVF